MTLYMAKREKRDSQKSTASNTASLSPNLGRKSKIEPSKVGEGIKFSHCILKRYSRWEKEGSWKAVSV